MENTDISIYLKPVEFAEFNDGTENSNKRMGESLSVFTDFHSFPELDGLELAIIGVREDRLSATGQGSAGGIDEIRKYFYKLFQGDFRVKIADLGDILPGHEVNDTYFALTKVLTELMQRSITPIIIGGSQDLTYAQYRAYENLGQIINIASIDAEFDLGNSEDHIDSKSWLSHIILHQPNYLFNFTNIGYQTYFVDNSAIRLMQNMYFDVYRLGAIRSNIEEAEPLVRNADMLTFDISAVRMSDAPGNPAAGPNGFYGEEICQLARYAGLSDKLSSFGVYEYYPDFDKRGQTAHLIAQMIWYFIEGYCNRKNDFPFVSKDDYLKYIVSVSNSGHDITFYKSRKSDRWWMNVPCTQSQSQLYERHYLVPCSYKDYEEAMKNEIPERWWQVYQKLMS